MEREEPAGETVGDASIKQESIVDHLGPYWTEGHIQKLPGDAKRTVQAGEALALPTSDDARIYPTWQFARTAEGDVVLKRGVAQVLAHLRTKDPWLVGLYLRRPMESLGGQAPITWLANGGDPDDIVQLFQSPST